MNKLIGHYFHAFEEKKEINWQKQIVREVVPDHCLRGCGLRTVSEVELLEWLQGTANGQRIAARQEMDWPFYPSAAEMTDYYARHPK